MKNKRSKAAQYPPRVRQEIIERDQDCIFCRMCYHIKPDHDFERNIFDIMHVIPKGQGGLGKAENGVLGCRYHHMMLDQGYEGHRDEMIGILEDYLRSIYPGWNREDMTYKKGALYG